MQDPTLRGNHDPCPACELRLGLIDAARFDRPEVPCNVWGGAGFLPLGAAEIVRRTCAEARRLYWPDFDRRNGLQ